MDSLQYPIDTVIHKIVTSENIYQSMLTEQHETYEWLMYLFLGIITIILTLAVLLNFYLFSIKIEKEISKIKSDFEKEVSKVKSNIEKELSEKLQKQFEEISTVLDKQITKQEAKASASAMQIQGNVLLREGNKYDAFISFSHSAVSYIDCSDKLNLMRVLKCMINYCLPSLLKSEILNLEKYKNFNLGNFVEKLAIVNENGELHDLISELKVAYDNAKEREILNKHTIS